MIKKGFLFICLLLFLRIVGFAQLSETARIKVSMKTINDSLKYVDALNRLGMLMYEKNIDSTFYYTRRAREIAIRLNYAKGKADALNNLGIFFDIKGDLQLALRYYNEAHTGYSKIKDSINIVQTTMNIAMVYKEFGKDQRAIQWFNIAVKKGKELRHDSIMSLVIYNYLLIYPNKFKPADKAKCINKAKGIALKYKDKRTLLAIEQLIADELIANGEFEKGITFLQKVLDSTINQKLYYVSMDMLIDLGDQLMAGDPTLAVNQYKRGIAIADKNGFLIYSKILARKLFDFYTLNGDNSTAAIYSHKLIILQEEQDKINNISSVDYLDYALKEQQIDVLVERSKYQITLLIITAIACLLAIVVIIVIRKNLKRIHKLNEQVINQNHHLEDTLVALEQSHADNTNMLKIVAHDLRSPIAGIYSITSLMIEEAGRSDGDHEMLRVIKSSSKDSLELVNDLLQTQFKTEMLSKEPIDLAEMLQYCVSLLQSNIEAKGQHIVLHLQPVILLASREKLWRVISNLLTNAIKFSPNQATIEVKMEEGAGYVRIGVADEGIGIPTEIEDKIFDMFTEARRPGTAGEQPFGLGLAISRQIVIAHGGKIWFERRAGSGTIFFIEFTV